MATLSWNEIRQRAIAFSREWADATSERAEAQTFWNEFFNVFGVRRRTVASFEEPVKNLKNSWSRIDLFWKGHLLAEHKSAGQDLSKAQSQAFGYIQELASQNRHEEIPQYVIVSDFTRFAVYDLESSDIEPVEFSLADLHKNIRHFAFISGYKVHRLREEDPANLKAAALMANLHDTLEAGGYKGSDLERMLVRILFCLFAEDTGIFEPSQFRTWFTNHTRADGSDVGIHLARLFDVLNTPPEARQKNLEEDLAAFEYVNGGLFAEQLRFADFNHPMRDSLLAAAQFDWSRISPAIFGSLFQGVMAPKERRQIGAHYTAERDILKVIRPLFLDQLQDEFGKAKKKSHPELIRFHEKLAKLRFLDPACGCGNFLVIAYRELRLLELELLKELYRTGSGELQQEFALPDDINKLSKLDVDQFYGIEIEEWPVRIAETALWLMDHQMNIRLSEAFGQLYKRLPLRKSAHITNGNALRLNWDYLISGSYIDLSANTLNVMTVEEEPARYDVVNVAARKVNILTEEEIENLKNRPRKKFDYIFGNPPFVGHQWRTEDQQKDVELVWGTSGRYGRLDYVTCWYRKAADYIQQTSIHCGFVSTNSISQGEQVGILWAPLFERGIQIDFAHRSFGWVSEARGAAHVDVVIIGFSQAGKSIRRIYDYDADPRHESATVDECANINPYLVAGPNLIFPSRTNPREGCPQMKKGSQPTDGGHLILTNEDKKSLLHEDPDAKQWLRKFIGGEELINGGNRWCLWLKDAEPDELRKHPRIMERIAKVRESRLKSPTASVREYAEQPTLFTQDRQPAKAYLAVPEVSSETRRYIPIAFLPPTVIASNKLQIIVGGTVYHFGVLSSAMHMAWVRVVSGRLESRLSYAPSVYNNYPWPVPMDKQYAELETAAQAVLDARKEFPNATLADLYDPLAMPPSLVKAHTALDRAVDKCYRPEPFTSERQRVEYLFALYEKLSAPLLPATPKKKAGRS